jgi:hypothetical protein
VVADEEGGTEHMPAHVFGDAVVVQKERVAVQGEAKSWQVPAD